MDLARKLALLDESLERRRGSESATPEESRRGTLDDLRRRMAEILGRPPAERRAPADPVATTLPFVRVEGDHGSLNRRLTTLPRSHHVGRIPASAAGDASMELLALVALDPGLADIDPRGALFLDTETTGLSGGAGTLAFLVGLAWLEEDRVFVEQVLLRTPGEEEAMLRHVATRIERATLLVSYNGKAFDLPLLDGRFVMNRIERPAARPHLDLLHVARRLHGPRIGGCSLKAVESEVLGFVRDGDVTGAEVAPRYAHFLRTGDEAALAAVVDHNAWDVVSMASLVGLYGEPLGALCPDDLVALSKTLRRAKAFERAGDAADRAVRSGAGPRAVEERAQVAKARGDRAAALADFESLCEELDDPAVRLELAKLYEHFVKEPSRALEVVARGTGESERAAERRRDRLERKARRGVRVRARRGAK